MEIRTCEEYVLSELNKAHNKIDELIDKNIEKENRINQADEEIVNLKAEIDSLNDKLDILLRCIDVEENHLSFYVWSGDHYYEAIKGFINEKEPVAEAN